MQILSILASPPKDFVFELFDKFNTNINSAVHSLQKVDLYTEKFNPIFVPELAYSDEILKYQNMVKIVDMLVFFHPVWHFGPPAILKGFLDKVFQEGFAYEFDRNYVRGLLKNKRAMVVTASRFPKWQTQTLFGNTLDLNWKRGVFGVSGIRDVKLKNFELIGSPSGRERELLALEEIKMLAESI